MSGRLEIYQQYKAAVDTLRTHFGNRDSAPFDEDNTTHYEFSTQIEKVDWLIKHLGPLASVLLPARFQLSLTIIIHDSQAKLQIYGDPEDLEADCESAGTYQGKPLPPPSTKEAAEIFLNLKDTIKNGTVGLSLNEILDSLKKLADNGTTMNLELKIFLDKMNNINKRLEISAKKSESSKVVSFLFPEAFKAILQSSSLEQFENDFFLDGRRSVIPIFGFSGYLSSEILTICGRGHENRLDNLLTKPLSNEVLQRTLKTLNFRQSENIWEFPITWLTPDTFDFNVDLAGFDPVTKEMRRQLKSLKALLSAIFLADRVSSNKNNSKGDSYQIEYRSHKRVNIEIKRGLLLDYENHLKGLYRLYVYAYEGFSSDRLETTQQFLTLIPKNLAELCCKAADVLEATRKTIARALVEKVKEYFESRHKIQERIQTAISETSNNVLSLSRDLSADLYKIAGVIAGAVVGVLLKPDLSLWVALTASIVISVYLCLVIFFHMGTLQRTYDLRMKQHKKFIQSFEDILVENELEAFQGDKSLKEIKEMFFNRRKLAKAIYCTFLAISLVVAIGSVVLLV